METTTRPRDGQIVPDRPSVLAVDDDEEILEQIRWALHDAYDVVCAADRPRALEVQRRQGIRVVLLDLGLPPRPREAAEGLRTLDGLLATDPWTKVIVVSGNAEREHAVDAVGRGAWDIFPKPVDIEQLRVVIERAFHRLDLEPVRAVSGDDHRIGGLIGSSPSMRRVSETVRKVAASDVPVLLTGETGTGKERVAEAIHRLSARREQGFVPIHCGAIPASLLESELFGHEAGAFTGATQQVHGRVEYASGGTLFLDEIGDLAGDLQVKLLRFLEEKTIERVGGREPIPVECRVVAASNLDFARAIREGHFREDLYFRLAGIEIGMPPLRERGGDLQELAEHFRDTCARELDRPARPYSKAALDRIQRYAWPGNVRELQNKVRRAVLLAEGPRIEPDDLGLEGVPQDAAGSRSLKEARGRLERRMVREALETNGWNIARTARELGVSRPTLYDMIERHGLEKS